VKVESQTSIASYRVHTCWIVQI